MDAAQTLIIRDLNMTVAAYFKEVIFALDYRVYHRDIIFKQMKQAYPTVGRKLAFVRLIWGIELRQEIFL